MSELKVWLENHKAYILLLTLIVWIIYIAIRVF